MRNLISETKVDNTFHVSQFCVPGYSVLFRLDCTGKGGGISTCRMKNKLKPLLLKILCVSLSGYWPVLTNKIFVIYRYT